jgi:hypothetical protein
MNRTILIIALSLITLIGLAQEGEKIRVARLAVKTAIEAEEKAKMEANFIEFNPDSLTTKKNILFMGKKDSLVFYYIKIRNKCYLLEGFDMNMKLNGETYNLRTEGDSIKCYADKGVILYTIQ